MWNDNIRNANIRGGELKCLSKILNGYENIDYNMCFEIKESKVTRGHNYTLVKNQSRLDVSKLVFIFPEDHKCMESIINRLCTC